MEESFIQSSTALEVICKTNFDLLETSSKTERGFVEDDEKLGIFYRRQRIEQLLTKTELSVLLSQICYADLNIPSR